MNSQTVKTYLLNLQNDIVASLSTLEQHTFITDEWQRAEGGGGLSRLIEGGTFLERGAVLFSHVLGSKLPPTAAANRPELAGRPWEAMGVSLVLHPRNPFAPTVHMNVRCFMAKAVSADETDAWWFGGGMDLTPYYGFVEDAVHFHKTNQDALNTVDSGYYPKFKTWCDDYFYLKHRQEARGIGGIFFDDFHEQSFDHAFNLMQTVGNAFVPAYLPIATKRNAVAYNEAHRDWQAIRRGRYVEFNLVFDRGTLFGLQSGGRTESILASLPPTVQWRYRYEPEAGSAEAKLLSDFLPARDWLGN
jgi:coproporphyrinogen III oxidase